MVRVLVLVLMVLIGFLLVYMAIKWLWQKATGKDSQVEGEKVEPPTWQKRLPAVVLILFVLLGALLIVDRLVNSEEGGVRHYAPATLESDGKISTGRRY